MPDLLEHMYCSQQINIPPNLPFILKQYAKAAIRTQPYDLLYWSAAYFRAKANDTPPPVKDRLEYPPVDSPSRLSPGFLKVLHKQLGGTEIVGVDILYEKWLGVCLVKSALDSMLKVGSFYGGIPWLKFVAIAAGYLCPSLGKTMVLICEVLTEEPDGGSAMVPVEVFVDLYEWLAWLDCGPEPPLITDPPAVTLSFAPPSHVSSDRDSKDESGKEAGSEVDLQDKDSSAGLMVWPDVRPEDQPDRVASPKYGEEPGASSEVGVEVLDDAKGVVTEVITLYSAQPEVKSEQAIYAPVESDKGLLSQSQIGSNILSHSSLRENENWIKIPAYEIDTESLAPTASLTTEVQDLSATTHETEAEEKSEGVVEEPEDGKEGHSEKESKTNTLANKLSDGVTEVSTGEDTQSLFNKKSSGKTIKSGTPTAQVGKQSSQDISPSGKDMEAGFDIKIMPSDDSVLGPGESVTVEQFIRDDLEGSTVTYSTAEIRRDLVGETSGERIERASSEDVVRAAQTRHHVVQEDDSSEEIVQELLQVKSLSGKVSSVASSFTVLSEDEVWQHVPGIGPMIPKQQVLAVVEYMQYWAAKQQGMVMPRNINHILCPPLDLPPAPEASEDNNHLY